MYVRADAFACIFDHLWNLADCAAFGMGAAFGEAVARLLTAQDLKGGEADRLVEAGARRVDAEQGGDAAELAPGPLQQVFVAQPDQARRLPRPGSDVL